MADPKIKTNCTNNATSKAGPSAANRVLTTYELLESIILHLPPVDAFLAAAVNPAWQSVVQTSPSITKKLRSTPTTQFTETHPFRDDPQNCCISIELDEARIIIRRIQDREIIGLLPKVSTKGKALRAVLVNEKRARLQIKPTHIRVREGIFDFMWRSSIDWTFALEGRCAAWTVPDVHRKLNTAARYYMRRYHDRGARGERLRDGLEEHGRARSVVPEQQGRGTRSTRLRRHDDGSGYVSSSLERRRSRGRERLQGSTPRSIGLRY